MPGTSLLHLRHNWPLAAAALVLAVLVACALLSGVLPTNRCSLEPAAYWRWLRRLSGLLPFCVAVLLGSYWRSVQGRPRRIPRAIFRAFP